MHITSITISGYRNIESVKLDFTSRLNALIGFNNYGKSNLIKGVSFGIEFLKADMRTRKMMMQSKADKPKCRMLKEKPFIFQIGLKSEDAEWKYSYSWYWDSAEVYHEELLRNKTIIHNRFLNTQVVPSLSLLIDKQHSSLENVYKWLKSLKSYGADLLNDVRSNTIIYKPSDITLASAIYQLQRTAKDKYELIIEAYTSLLPNVEQVNASLDNGAYKLSIIEKYIEEEIPFEYLSMGSRRLMALLYMALMAEDYDINILFIEEIETCLHPRLLPLLLMSLTKLASKSNIIITSHSPYLIQHLPLENIYLSTPQKEGVVGFKTVNPELQNKLIKQATELEISLGVYLFDLLIESYYEPDILEEWQ